MTAIGESIYSLRALVEMSRLSDCLLDIPSEGSLENLGETLSWLQTKGYVDDEEVSQVRVVLDMYIEGKQPPLADRRAALDILAEKRRSLSQILEEDYAPVHQTENPRVDEYKDLLRAKIEKEAGEQRSPQDNLLNLIESYPGLFVEELVRLYNEQFRPKRAYETIRQYLNQMEEEDKILTTGGPQGRYRYCFPQPESLAAWEQYYDGFGAVKGTVGERLSRSFRSMFEHFKDVHFVNSHARPTLIVTRWQKAELSEDSIIACSGRLHPCSDDRLEEIGLKELSDTPDADFLLEAAQIEDEETSDTIYEDEELFEDLRRSHSVHNS